MKRTVKKIGIIFVALILIVVSCLPMVAFEVKRYYGDVDNDGKVTVVDARTILRAAIDISENTLSEHDFDAADVDGDDKLTTNDARLALRMAAHLEAMEYMPSYEFNKHEEDVLELINEYRKTASDGTLKRLEVSPELCEVADKAAYEYVTQTGSALRRGDGSYYNTLLDENNVTYTVADKVMCVSTTSYAQAFDKIISVKQSCKALTSQNFSEIGVGAYSKDGHTVYWCIILVG